MLTPLRLPRAIALLALAAILFAPDADAQRRGTTPTYTVVLGGVDFLLATGAYIGRTALTPRSDLGRVDRLRLTGLSLPDGGPKGGDCDFEAPTCNGRIVVTDPSASPVRMCYDLFEVAITPGLSDAASGVLKEEMVVEFTTITRAGPCAQDE